MEIEQYNQAVKNDKIEVVPPTTDTTQVQNTGIDISNITPGSMEEYLPLLEVLRKIKPYRTTAPTATPRTLLDQFELYDDNTNFRLYIYLNKTRGWKYLNLL